MTSDPKGRKEPGFVRHAFVCGHERPQGASRPSCLPNGSLDLMKQLKQAIRESGVEGVRVQKAGCLDHCEYGPTCVVYPEGVWYRLEGEAAIKGVLKHLVTGSVAEEHRLVLD